MFASNSEYDVQLLSGALGAACPRDRQIAFGVRSSPGSELREIRRLRRMYGIGHWRKRKGIASVRLTDGSIRRAEIHWYEASGIGRFEFKIKAYVD